MRKGLLLYNPAAGRHSIRPYLRGILAALRAADWRTDVAETLSGTHATQTAHQAAQEKYDAVFAIGGDGTIGQVASGLLHSETALAVLPSGTANVWALEQGLKPFRWRRLNALRENAKALARAKVQTVDVGDCNGNPFLLWAGIGLDARAIRRIEPRPRFFKYFSVPHFFAATVYEASVWHGLNLRIRVEGELIEGHVLVALASNIRHYVGGMSLISPGAFLDDGEMELWLLSGDSLTDAFRHFYELLSGKHLTSDQARCIPFRNALIESDANFSMQVDGDPMLGGRSANIRVLPRALKTLMPENALYLLKTPQR